MGIHVHLGIVVRKFITRSAPLLLLVSAAAFGQGSFVSFVIQTPQGAAIPGATVALCSSKPTTTTPCGSSTLQATFTDITLATACTLNPTIPGPTSGVGCTNPGVATGFGTVYFYGAQGLYYYQSYGQGILVPDVEPIQFSSITGGGGGGGVTIVQGTTNQVVVTNGTTTPTVALAANTVLPGNASSTGNLAVGANLAVTGTSNLTGATTIGGNVTITGPQITAFSQTMTGFQGTGNLFVTTSAAAISGNGYGCFIGGLLGNVGCPPITASASGSNAEVQFRNPSTGLLASDPAYNYNSVSQVLNVQNVNIGNSIIFAHPALFTSSFPVNPLTPPAVGQTSWGVDNSGLLAECPNGGACTELSTVGGTALVAVPVAAQHVVQPVSAGATTPLDSNNFANIRYVTPTWNWSQTPGGSLTAGAVTITLTPCPAGIDTASAANHYVYAVYISGGTGTAEAMTVTGGSCTSGAASGTITGTAANNHTGSWTVGSSTAGIQEAWNDAWVNDSGANPIANSQAAPSVKLSADTTYNIYSSIYMRGRGGILDGGGAFLSCFTRDRCLYIGTNASLAAVNYHKVRNVIGTSNITVDGSQVASVCAGSACSPTQTNGIYFVTTQATDAFVVGDTVDCEYHSQNAEQRWVATVLSTPSATTFTVNIPPPASQSFATSATTFGWCNILNTFIEDNSDYAIMDKVEAFTTAVTAGTFSHVVVIDNDQQAHVNGLTNRAKGAIIQNTANWPIGSMVFTRGDQGNAGILYLKDAEITNVNGVDAWSGNGTVISDSVIQGFPLFGTRTYGSLQPTTVTNLYEESTGATTNPLYGQAAQMGLLGTGRNGVRIVGGFPIDGWEPTFSGSLGSCSGRYYWAIPQSSALGHGPMYFIGSSSTTNCAGNITVKWPMVDLRSTQNVSVATLTWDVLVTTGSSSTTVPPTGTGSYSITTASTGVTCTNGICSFTDTQAAPSSYTVNAQQWQPVFWFWPVSYVVTGAFGNATSPNIFSADNLNTGPSAVASQGSTGVSILAANCTSSGVAAHQSPIWIQCQSAGSSSGANSIATVVQQRDQAGNGATANSKGRYNLGAPSGTVPVDLLTLADSNFAKTAVTPGMRPSNDAADMALGMDQVGGLSLRANTSISRYIASINDNASEKERLTATTETYNVGVTLSGSNVLTVGGNATVGGTWGVTGNENHSGTETHNGAVTIGNTLNAYHALIVKTSNFVLTSAQSGGVAINTGASGEVDFTLPACSTNFLYYTGIIDNAQVVKFIASSGAKIRSAASLGTANGNITASTTGNSVTLQCIGTSGADGVAEWVTTDVVGTWTVN